MYWHENPILTYKCPNHITDNLLLMSSRDVTIYRYIAISWYTKPVIQCWYKLSCIDISNIGIYWLSCMIYPCFDLNTAYYVYCVMTDFVVVCQFFSSVTLVSTKHDGIGKRLCLSAKNSYTVSCNISLYRDTKEVIYQYTQNVYRPISNVQSCLVNVLFCLDVCTNTF